MNDDPQDDLPRPGLEERELSWCYEHGCYLNDCMGIHIAEDEELA